MMTFEQKLRNLINTESMENGSDTPDFILARYLMACLMNFNTATKRRALWYTNDHSDGTEPSEIHTEGSNDG